MASFTPAFQSGIISVSVTIRNEMAEFMTAHELPVKQLTGTGAAEAGINALKSQSDVSIDQLPELLKNAGYVMVGANRRPLLEQTKVTFYFCPAATAVARDSFADVKEVAEAAFLELCTLIGSWSLEAWANPGGKYSINVNGFSTYLGSDGQHQMMWPRDAFGQPDKSDGKILKVSKRILVNDDSNLTIRAR